MKTVRRIILALLSIAGLAVVMTTVAPQHASAATSIVRLNASRQVAAGAKHYIGDSYAWGGTGPSSFDCSGLAQYVYKKYAGVSIPRMAEDQYHYFRAESKGHAWGGDLVFFHDASGYVYHTGIWEGGNGMVNAVSPQYGVRQTPLSWGGRYVTYGTISH